MKLDEIFITMELNILDWEKIKVLLNERAKNMRHLARTRAERKSADHIDDIAHKIDTAIFTKLHNRRGLHPDAYLE